MTALYEPLFRLAAGGIVISFLLALSGKSAGKEIVRFAAACVTAIHLAGALRGVRSEKAPLTLREAVLEQELEQARDEALRLQAEEAERALAAYLEGRAAARSVICTANVFCVNADNKITIKHVDLTVKSGNPEALSDLIPAVASELGVSEDAITVREERP